MLSLLHHPQTLLLLLHLFLLSLIYTLVNGNSVIPPQTSCPSFNCGNGALISYPFWHQHTQQDYCGYLGFGLTCLDHYPVLHLSQNLYQVKNINYFENTLTLSYPEIKEQNCPMARDNVTLDTSLLHYSSHVKIFQFFYNCTLYPPSLPYINCLNFGSKRSYMFMVEEIPEFDWIRFCESVVTVPLVVDTLSFDGRNVSSFGGQLMQDGFELKWRAGATCRSCEATGGFCGYRNGFRSNFICLCSDGHHTLYCGDNDFGSDQFGSVRTEYPCNWCISFGQFGYNKWNNLILNAEKEVGLSKQPILFLMIED